MLYTLIICLVTSVAAAAIALQLPSQSFFALFALLLATSFISAWGAQAVAGRKPAPKAAPTRTRSSLTGRLEGEIKWFNVSKGFGFITGDDGEDVFVHFKAIEGGNRRGLKQGHRVSFRVGQSPKGPQAEAVKPLPA